MSKNPHAQALGRLGGLSRSPAKQAAARKNGLRGKPRLHSWADGVCEWCGHKWSVIGSEKPCQGRKQIKKENGQCRLLETVRGQVQKLGAA